MNVHALAHVMAWAADPFDRRDVANLRATCRFAVRAFDVAVHAGWIALAMHDSTVPDDDGATYRWVNGWIPADTLSPGASVAQLPTVRLEHRLIASDKMVPKWTARHVAVCETLQPDAGVTELYTPIIAACAAERMEWRLARSTRTICHERWRGACFWTRFGGGGCGGLASGLNAVTSIGSWFLKSCASLTSFDASGLSAVTKIGDGFLDSCTSLTSFDTSGLSAVTSIGDKFLGFCTKLTSLDTCGLGAATTIGSCFLESCTSLTSFDASGLRAVTRIGSWFLYSCTSVTSFDASGLGAVTIIRSCFLDSCTSLTSFDASGLSAVTKIGDGFLESCTSLTIILAETSQAVLLSHLPRGVRIHTSPPPHISSPTPAASHSARTS
jgi:hypothetical protein